MCELVNICTVTGGICFFTSPQNHATSHVITHYKTVLYRANAIRRSSFDNYYYFFDKYEGFHEE